jgi:membrane fusion protein, multidrug efflux system
MSKKIVFIIIGISLVILVLFFGRRLFPDRRDTTDEMIAPAAPTPVRTLKVENQNIPIHIEITGRLQPEEIIEVFAEVSGILLPTNPPFRQGNTFNQGQVMIRINDDEHRQQLIAQRTDFLSTLTRLLPDIRLDFEDSYPHWVNYIENFDPQQRMPSLPEPQSSQERFFLTGRNVFSQYHNIRQLEIQASKFQIRAPFRGTVSQSNIHTGTLVRQGQPLGSFAKIDSYELEATVRVTELQHLKIGNHVRLNVPALGIRKTGTIVRLSDHIDPATQTITVFIRVQGSELKQGMFMSGLIEARTIENAFRIPREIMLQNNQVFFVEDSVAVLRTINVLHIMEDTIVAKGLQDGDLIINERRPAHFEGTRVNPMNNELDLSTKN